MEVAAGPADFVRPYFVRADPGAGVVEAWSGYPLQFGGQRRFAWQDDMADELRQALSGLPTAPGAVLAGSYLSTDHARCDVENRLFTNPGTSSFPKGLAAIRFERGVGPLPPPPVPVARIAGHLHYYCYRLGAAWRSWEPADLLARWHRVTRHLADDSSCRSVWLAMRAAAAAGQVEVLAPRLPVGAEFGVRAVIHATSRGPRQAAAVSETVLDGIIAAFHAGLGHGPAAAAAAAALASKLPGTTAAELEALVAGSLPGPLFASSAFVVKGTYVQINPCDDRCQAGEITIQLDADGPYPQISGELFALRRAPA
jgi:hypothetical protein